MFRSFPFVLVIGLLAVIGAALVVVPASRVEESVPQAAQPTPEQSRPLRVAVVGDSLSAGRSRFLGNGLDDEAWVSYADGDGIEYVGGWARSGATPDEMADAVQPIDDVDVLVVLAGTNAVRDGTPLAEESSAYAEIVRVVGAERVFISAIPPYDAHRDEALQYNVDLQALVAEHGWTWVDPWTAARDGDEWAPGFSTDGTHPAGPEQYRVLGEAFRRIILETRTLPSALGV